MAEVVRFDRGDGMVGEGTVITPDVVLKEHVGLFDQVVVAGLTPDGQFVLAGSHSSREALWLLRRGEHFLFGSDA